MHRAQASVRQGLFLNSAHHMMSRRRSTFQLFACHHKHVSIFLCHHKAGWRMLRASSETASVARDLRVKTRSFQMSASLVSSCSFSISVLPTVGHFFVCVLCQTTFTTQLSVTMCMSSATGALHLLRKHLPRMFSLFKNESLGIEDTGRQVSW